MLRKTQNKILKTLINKDLRVYAARLADETRQVGITACKIYNHYEVVCCLSCRRGR